MNKLIQVACVFLVAVSAVSAGIVGYPYAGVPVPHAYGYAHGLPAPVHDTPEVAAAKAAHFAAYNAAAAAAAAAPDHGVYGAYDGAHYAGPYAVAGVPGYAGHYGAHYAGVPAIVNGVPADTPEVAAAKAAHFAAHAHAAHHG
ncbi:cuticle protein 2-like [Periplaneta americana]|uniref:cuticle protein 2-like n=1 Tax=Periplaneta americana TaxID=6978 RepID=UPI0037E94C6B